MQPSSSPSSPSPLEQAELHPCNHRADIDRVEKAILGALEKHHYPESARFAVRLSVEEALVNAFQHGHRGLPPDTPVTVHYCVSPDEVVVSITDRGPGFAPEQVPDPTAEDNIELPSGRGLMLMRAYMHSVEHDLGGKRVTMTYRRGGS